MLGTVGELAQQPGIHRRESARQWAVAQVEELFVVRVRLVFGQPEVLPRNWGKKPPVLVAASCWLILQVCSKSKRSSLRSKRFVPEAVAVAEGVVVVVGQREAALLVWGEQEGEEAVL